MFRETTRLLYAIPALLTLLLPTRPAVAQTIPKTYSVIDVTIDKTGTPHPNSVVTATNNAGQVVGLYQSGSVQRGFVWDGVNLFRDIGQPASRIFINNAGQIAYLNPTTGASYVITPTGTGVNANYSGAVPVAIPTLPGYNPFAVTAINNSGQVVGYTNVVGAADYRGMYWDPVNGVRDIGFLPGTLVRSTVAGGINDSGIVSAYAEASDGTYHAAYWTTSSQLKDLGKLAGYPALNTGAINNSGQIIGVASNTAATTFVAFLCNASGTGPVSIGLLSGYSSSIPDGINNNGEVVGVAMNSTGAGHAAVWTSAGGWADLNSKLDPSGDGWTLTSANCVNDSGWIGGTGTYQGAQRAFVLMPSNATQILADRLHFVSTGTSEFYPGMAQLAPVNFYIGDLSNFGKSLLTWNTGTHTIGGYFDPCFGGWTIDPCFGFFGGCPITIPGFCLGDFGAEGTFGSSGQTGLVFHASANTGSVNLNYPMTVTVMFPDRADITQGVPFTVTSRATADSGTSLATTSPTAEATLDAVFDATNTATVAAKAFGATLFDFSLLPSFLENISWDYNILDTNALLAGNSSYSFSLDDGVVTGNIRLPNLTSSGGLNSDNSSLSSSGSDMFFSLVGSITNLISTSIIYIPLSFDDTESIGGSELGGSVHAYGGLLQLDYKANFSVAQNFSFAPALDPAGGPAPTIQLAASSPVIWIDNTTGVSSDGNNPPVNGSTTVTFNAGDSVTMTIPYPGPTVISFTPTVSLPNTFNTNTSIVFNGGFDFDPFYFGLHGSASTPFGDFNLVNVDVNPIDLTFLSSTASFPIWTKSYPLPVASKTLQMMNVACNIHPAPALASATPSGGTMYIINDNDPVLGTEAAFDTYVSGASTAQYAPNTTPPYTNGAITVTLQGSNITTDTVAHFVYYNTDFPLTTTVFNAGTLTAQFPNYFFLLPGTGRFYLKNEFGMSNTLTFTIDYPTPTLQKAGPNIWADDPNFNNLPISVVGTNFIDIPDYFQANDGLHPLRHLQTYWGDAIANHLLPANTPTLPNLFPGFDWVDPAALPTVFWSQIGSSTPVALSQYGEPSASGLLPSILPHAQLAQANLASVYIVNPGPANLNLTSTPVTVWIAAPSPVLKSMSPNSAQPGAPNFRLIVTGESNIPNDDPIGTPQATGFVDNSVVYFNGVAMPTTCVTPTELHADIPASAVANAGVYSVYVVNPSIGLDGSSFTQTSALMTFTVANPMPALVTLNPPTAVSADPGFNNGSSPNTQDVRKAPGGGGGSVRLSPKPATTTVTYNFTVTGTGFVPTSVVYLNGAARPTQYVSSQQLAVSLPAGDVALPANNMVTVVNPPPGGGTSTGMIFPIQNAVPQLPAPPIPPSNVSPAPLTPASIPAGSDGFLLTVQGSGFYSGSTVYVNGQARATNFVSSNIVTAMLLASDVATAGNVPITVGNPPPGGGTSSAVNLLATGSAFAVAGIVTMQGCLNPAQTVAFKFRDSSGNLLFSRTVALSSTGAYSLPNIPAGSYLVGVKGSKWLQTDVNVTLTSGSLANIGVTLLPGDMNGDNVIDLDDFSVFVNAFGSTQGDPTWNPNADLNCDGVVDLDDFSLFVVNFGDVGAP